MSLQTLRRPGRRDVTRPVGVALIGLLALCTLAIHLRHLLTADERPIGLLFGAVFPTAFSLVFLLSCYGLHRRSIGERALRIALWSLAGALTLISMATFSVLHQQILGAEVREVAFTLNNYATGGAVLGLLVGVYDAKRKDAAAELDCQRETAEVLSHRLTVLNRVLRHDIRTNVNIIQGYSESIFDDSQSASVAGRIILEAATELHRLSENARVIERALGAGDIETRPMDLAPLVAAQVETAAAKFPRARLEFSAPAPIRVEAAELVETALANVLENAVEHNDKDVPVVSIEVVEPVASPGGFAEIRIADNGPGLPETQQAVLERGHETDLEHSDGLGLWLADWIVADFDGEMRFEGNDPTGTVVTVGLRPAESAAR